MLANVLRRGKRGRVPTFALFVSGCADVAADASEDVLYHQDVNYYEGRGVSHQNAERTATEDDMENGRR